MLDLASLSGADPYPIYRRLRQAGSILKNDKLGAWIFPGYAGVKFMLENPAFSAQRGDNVFERFPEDQARLLEPLRLAFSQMMMLRDGESHTSLRTTLGTALSAQNLRHKIAARLDAMLEVTLSGSRFDAIAELAYPFPLQVIADLLGLPNPDLPWLRLHSQRLATSYGVGRSAVPSFQIAWDGQVSVLALKDCLREAMESGKAEGLLAYVAGRDDSEKDLLLSNLIFFILAGHETTTHLIGNGLWRLTRDPSLADRLRASPDKIPAFVEEVLRLESPVQLTSRVARTPVVFDGRTIEEGQRVFGLLGSANRDESVFADAETLDLDRAPQPRHLAFGGGAHFCLGATLARLEARLFFEKFLERVLHFTAGGSPAWGSNVSFRGLDSLVIEQVPVPLGLDPN